MSLNRTFRVLHLAHDHLSVRMLHDLLDEEDGWEQHWWLDPDYQIAHAKHHWKGALPDRRAVEACLASPLDLIILHRLKGGVLEWVPKLPEGVPVIWASWGDDYYRHLNDLNRSLFLPRTRVLNAFLGKFSVTWIRMKNFWKGNRDPFHQALGRMNGVTAFLGENAPFLSHLPAETRVYRSLYNQLPSALAPEWCTTTPGRVLLGTSGLNSGNHADLIHALRRSPRPVGVQYTAALSYGCPRYRWSIDQLGRWQLNASREKWSPQWEHLSPEDYAVWLRQFSSLILYNISIQSTGVVVLALHAGLHVWMRADAHFTAYFQSQGFKVGVLAANEIPLAVYVPLTPLEREHNRQRVQGLFGKDAILAAFRNIAEDAQSGRLGRPRIA